MNKFIALAVAAVLLTACDKRTTTDAVTDTDTDTPTVVPGGDIAIGDLKGAVVGADGETLLVQITLDGDDALQEYEYETDVGAYQLFTLQQTPTDRSFTAFSGVSEDGSVQAVVVSEGGQFNRFFGGATVSQNDYSAPTGGIVNYTGEYVGLLNFGSAAGPGVPGSVSSVPYNATQVFGTVYLKADFTDGALNGSIYNRTADVDGGPSLPEMVLVIGDIAADGSFSGDVEDLEQATSGTYSGVFGGSDATSVAGAIELTAGFLPLAFPDPENAREFGIFVIEREADAF